MIKLFFIAPEFCSKPLKLLCYIGTRCGHHKEFDPQDQSKVLCLEISNPFAFLVALKLLPHLLKSISKVIAIHFLGLLRLTEFKLVALLCYLKHTF